MNGPVEPMRAIVYGAERALVQMGGQKIMKE
jgi:hypothetical protein